jgi:paraquat-inducible protein A
MLEVYVISLLVSVIKLIGMAAVTPGIGMLCLVGMMLSSIAVKVTLCTKTMFGERLKPYAMVKR